MPFALVTFMICATFVRSAHAVVLVRVHATAFVDYRGNHYAPAEDDLIIDYEGGDYWLSGFGLFREPVRPYLSSHLKRNRSLVFRATRANSKLRPAVTIRPDGRAFLITTRLAGARLALSGLHWIEPGFHRHTFVTNAMRLRVTFDNSVARAWRGCSRWLRARGTGGAGPGL